jgi:HK97 family phage major capsid protein
MITTNNYNRSFWNAARGNKESYLSMNEGSDNTGAYLLPSDFRDKFNANLSENNLFRRLGTTVNLSSPEGIIQAVTSTGIADWVTESNLFTESSDTFTPFSVKSHKLASLSRIKSSFVGDMNFDIEKYLLGDFSKRFGRAEENAFINGNGITQPTGILGADAAVITANKSSILFDEVVKLYFSLKAEYRNNAVFIMHDETAMLLRTIKDSNGNYLWNSSNDTIFSKQVLTSPHMPTVGSGAKCIAFGDISYYWIVERQPLSVKILTELYVEQGQIGFSAFERLDGKLIQPDAVKIMKMAD